MIEQYFFVIYFVVSLTIAGALFFTRARGVQILLQVLFLTMQTVMVGREYGRIGLVEESYFKADALGWLFLCVTSVVAVAVMIHSELYARERGFDLRISALHHSALVAFVAMCSGALLSAHIGTLWAFLEATTLTGSVLIYHHRNAHSLEAAWKYIFVCSVGLALAFAALLFVSSVLHEAPRFDLSIDYLTSVMPTLQHADKGTLFWFKLSFLFALTGFSVKMGVAPLFNVDIDAKDVSPSPFGALLSGGLMNVGFVAIFRFYQIFSGTLILEWMNHVLIIAGVLSVFFATVFLLKITNYKRMFAYSSLEHGGLALIALAMGREGLIAAALHLTCHALIKSSLFFQIGQAYRIFKSKHLHDVGGYLILNPAGALVLLIGFFFITAAPPSGLFVSEWMTLKALISQGYAWLAIILVILITFIIFSLGKGFFMLLFQKARVKPGFERIPVYESFTQYAFLLAVVWLAYFPPQEFVTLLQDTGRLIPATVNLSAK